MDGYDWETQLSGFGKASQVAVMAPDNLSREAVERILGPLNVVFRSWNNKW